MTGVILDLLCLGHDAQPEPECSGYFPNSSEWDVTANEF